MAITTIDSTLDVTALNFNELRGLAKDRGLEIPAHPTKAQLLELLTTPAAPENESAAQEDKPKRAYRAVPRSATAARREANAAAVREVLATATDPMGVSQIHSLIESGLDDARWSDTYHNVRLFGCQVEVEGSKRTKYMGVQTDDE